ncbi:MAG: hypothetical protein ACO1Q7_21045 [Gemmatimonas sp.]
MRKFVVGLVVGMLAWLTVQGRLGAPSSASAPPPPVVQEIPAPSAAESPRAPASAGSTAISGKGFRDQERLDDHFAKHGAEFPGLNKREYLAMAQQLRDAPAGNSVLEVVRPSDGVVSRFDKSSGAFIAFERDGTIRTFFKPNDGEAYFRRQARRSPER